MQHQEIQFVLAKRSFRLTFPGLHLALCQHRNVTTSSFITVAEIFNYRFGPAVAITIGHSVVTNKKQTQVLTSSWNFLRVSRRRVAKTAHLLLFDPLPPGVLLSGSCWPTPFTSPRALANRNAIALGAFLGQDWLMIVHLLLNLV